MHVSLSSSSPLQPAACGSKSSLCFLFSVFCLGNKTKAHQQCGSQTSLREGRLLLDGNCALVPPPLTTTRSPRIGHCIPVCLTHAVSTSSEVAVWLTCSQVKGRGNLPLLLLLLFLLQKCATTFISRPEAAPEPWAWFDAWPTSMWWSPELKLAHSRLAESQGDRETSGPAPSTDSVAKHAADERVTGGSAAWSCDPNQGWIMDLF